ncbi:hypothetical protein [Halobacillus salinus]|uniref:hypothetical protein n=1 Tax=Halobacillus salinus TaxID=192814 RepID=UPI0009A76644|nr:hypothetical protein [Halobacillus salinus]
MERKNILTVGSCLSATVADKLEQTGRYYRKSSVQHNRIDQFMETYVYEQTPPLKEEDVNLSIKSEHARVNVFRNQFEDQELGKALPFKRDTDSFSHPISTINNGDLDLLILDNYADMFFKVYRHKEKLSKFFVNKGYLNEEPVTLEFINELLDPSKAVSMYEDLIHFCKKKNKELATIFINFPVNLKNKEILNERENSFRIELENIREKHDNFFIIEPWEIEEMDLSNPKDPYHFTAEKYKEYSLECESLLYLAREKCIKRKTFM